MNVQEALYLRMTADAGVSAIATGGIWNGVLSQDALYPAIAYRRMDKETPLRLESRGHSGIAGHRFRFYSAAQQQDDATELDEALRLCLHGFSGTITNTDLSPDESLDIQGIFQTNTFDFYDDPTQTYQVISDYDVWAEEPRPT